jgi:hypothetical protein
MESVRHDAMRQEQNSAPRDPMLVPGQTPHDPKTAGILDSRPQDIFARPVACNPGLLDKLDCFWYDLVARKH